MWFRRKQRNRRLSRMHVLEVQLRSGARRAARTRFFALALGVIFSVVFGGYLLWRVVGWSLDAVLYENRAFAIRDIEVQTDGVISLEQLRRWAGAKLGDNLLALDLTAVKRNLEYVPYVASASAERVLPNTLRLRVAERESMARVNLPRLRTGGGVDWLEYHLDAGGCVMPTLDPRRRSTPIYQTAATLPLLSGVNPHDLQPGRRVESPAVQSALQLIGAFAQSPMLGLAELRRVDVGAGGVLVVTTEVGSEITFGLEDFEQQLLRWRAVHDAGTRMQRVLASLDLAVADNLPVRWLEPERVPPAPQKSSASVSGRKKDV